MRNFKRIGLLIIGIIVFFAVIRFMDLLLYPCTYIRNDIHTVLQKQADVLIMGTSNSKMGINTDPLLEGTGYSGHNLAAGSEYPVDSYYMLKLVLEKQKPKYLIYDIDPGYFVSEKEKGNNYVLFLHEFPLSRSKIEYEAAIIKDSDIRAWLFPFYEYPLKTTIARSGDSFRKKITGDYGISDLKNNIQEYHENGYIEKYPVAEEDFPKYDPIEFESEDVYQSNIDYMKKLIGLCRENDITFVAISMPLPEKTIEMSREGLTEAERFFSDFFEEQGVEYYDFNIADHDFFSHAETDYVDYTGHMNGESAAEFSRALRDKIGIE